MRVFMAGVGNWSWLLIPLELGITVELLYSERMVWGQILSLLLMMLTQLYSTLFILTNSTVKFSLASLMSENKSKSFLWIN